MERGLSLGGPLREIFAHLHIIHPLSNSIHPSFLYTLRLTFSYKSKKKCRQRTKLSNNPCHFPNLPAGTRLLSWSCSSTRLILTRAPSKDIPFHATSSRWDIPPRQRRYAAEHDRFPSILRTNRQIGSEAVPILYSELPIYLRINDLPAWRGSCAKWNHWPRLWRHDPRYVSGHVDEKGNHLYDSPDICSVIEPHVFFYFKNVILNIVFVLRDPDASIELFVEKDFSIDSLLANSHLLNPL